MTNAASKPVNYEESQVGPYTLPDPLAFVDGRPVRTAQQWPERRAEILALFEDHVFGHSPQPQPVYPEVFEADTPAFHGKAIRRQIRLAFSADQQSPKADLLIYLPVDPPTPVPLILMLNFPGNHSVTSDPAVRLGTVWNREIHQPEPASEETRGSDVELDVEKILARGYGFATVCYQDIEPDFQGGYVHGIRPLFLSTGQTEPGPDDWGALGAWSYGLSRAMDYFEKDSRIDAGRVAIMGHSRLGKTVLWAGASDTRFAMVLCSCSGAGGAALARRDYGERIDHLVANFPYWFCGNYQHYAGHPERLPVDAHELIALNAPRPVYITGAEEDRWADPKGEFLACVAAGPVYRLLGASDLGTDTLPPLDQPIQQTLAFHLRRGKHAVTAFDWEQFLAFADKHLGNSSERGLA